MYTKLGLQLYSVRNHMEDEQGVRETFQKLADMGYTQAQTAGMPCDVHAFADAASKAGIEIIGTHYTFPEDLNNLEEYINFHKILGTTNAGVGGGCAYGTREQIEAFITKVNTLVEKIAPYGMKFTYHHHSYEFAKSEGRRVIEYLYDGLDARNTSFVMDTYWMQYAGVDINAWLKKFEGRVDILHIKDMAVTPGKNDPFITEIGNGNIDFETVLRTAEDTGVKYICVEQDEWPADSDSLDSVKKSCDYFMNILSK